MLVANAYFVPTPAISEGLKDAARRCVAVTLVSNSPETNDLPEISMVGRGYYKDLLAVNDSPEVAACENEDAGLHFWEWFGEAEGDPVIQGTMHSKYAVADRRIALVGSYNLDPRSENLNNETAIVFEQPETAAELAAIFIWNDLHYSRPVTPGDAAEFADPEDVLYRYRKTLAEFFEDEF